LKQNGYNLWSPRLLTLFNRKVLVVPVPPLLLLLLLLLLLSLLPQLLLMLHAAPVTVTG
jgi:hypothetical protein